MKLSRATKTTIVRLSFVMTRKGRLLLVRCSNCGKCCERTEMELSSNDIERLEETGYRREEFAVVDDGVTRLRNVGGWRYFYSLADKKCRAYGKRPWDVIFILLCIWQMRVP